MLKQVFVSLYAQFLIEQGLTPWPHTGQELYVLVKDVEHCLFLSL